MCKQEEKLNDLPPPAMRADSTISSSSDGSESDDSNERSAQPNIALSTTTRRRQLGLKLAESSVSIGSVADVTTKDDLVAKKNGQDHAMYKESNNRRSLGSTSVSVIWGVANASFWIAFSLYFPFILAPHAATQTYHTAFYHYDPQLSHFDNTIWTYGTDYALAVIMAGVAYSILRYSRPQVSDQLCMRSASLLMLYGVSVIAGGCAHQFFTTLESRNSLAFRFLWTVCVGTVCAASCSMGMSGREALRKFQQYERLQQQQNLSSTASSKSSPSLLQAVPLLSDAFWLAFRGTVTAVCAMGGISFQRPACDIFIAGITQSPSTFYCMIFFFLVQHPRVQAWAKVMGFVGFILNAPLLPMYPLLVQYTDWSLASVNTLLHCWLCVAWSMQGISMKHVISALVSDMEDQQQQSVKKVL
jgi:hypothetical protein